MRSSSRKRGLEGVEASSQLFPSGYGEDQATSSEMPLSLGANLKCEPYHWPCGEANAVRFFFCLHVKATSVHNKRLLRNVLKMSL